MLFLISRNNHLEMGYNGGQEPIVHLEALLSEAIEWANDNRRRWAFTLSNAGSYFFEDRANLDHLHEIDWDAVQSNHWSGNGIMPGIKERKQAEFLIEQSFPWHLVFRIGVSSSAMNQTVQRLNFKDHRPVIEVKPDWYY